MRHVYIVAFHLYVWICPHGLFYKDVKWIQASSLLKASPSWNSGCLGRTILFFPSIQTPNHKYLPLAINTDHVTAPGERFSRSRDATVTNLIPSQHISGRITLLQMCSTQTARNVQWELCTLVSKGHNSTTVKCCISWVHPSFTKYSQLNDHNL